MSFLVSKDTEYYIKSCRKHAFCITTQKDKARKYARRSSAEKARDRFNREVGQEFMNKVEEV